MATTRRSRVSKKTTTAMRKAGISKRSKAGSKPTKEKCAKVASKVRGSKSAKTRSTSRGIIASSMCKTGTKKKGNPKYKSVRMKDKDGVVRTRYVLKKKKK